MADKPAQQNAKIGLISRIDASSDGFRKGLLDAIFHILKETEGTHFNILVGGLVGKKSLAEKISGCFADFRKKKKLLAAKPKTLNSILAAGSKKASIKAFAKISEVKKKVGLA